MCVLSVICLKLSRHFLQPLKIETKTNRDLRTFPEVGAVKAPAGCPVVLIRLAIGPFDCLRVL